MPQIFIQPTAVVIRFYGIEKLWALRSELRLEKVLGAWVTDFRALKGVGLRIPGTAVPGWFAAGSFWSRKLGWSFIYVRRNQQVLALNVGADKFRRVFISMPAGAQSLADQINDLVSAC